MGVTKVSLLYLVPTLNTQRKEVQHKQIIWTQHSFQQGRPVKADEQSPHGHHFA